MTMTVDDPIRGQPRGSLDEALAFVARRTVIRPADLRDYLGETFRLAPLVGLDPAVLVAQSAAESGYWTEDEWERGLNPAAIRVGDVADVSAPYATGIDAARAQIVHLYAYVHGRIPDGHALAPFRHLDPRYEAVFAAGWGGSVDTIAGLAGTWATDPAYHTKIVARGNAIFPNLPHAAPTGGARATAEITFGRVPHPPFERRIVDKRITNSATRGFDRLGPRQGQIVGTCVHRMDGTLLGSEHHFWRSDVGALTDYGIGGLLDGDRDGVVFMWNEPEGDRSPWASGWGPEGPGLEGDGPAFLAAFPRPGDVNKCLVSIELSGLIDRRGHPDTPLTDRQMEGMCRLIAYWHDRAGVPWDLFPVHPASGVVTQMQHWKFARKNCPGELLKQRTDEYQARVRRIMRRYQLRQDITSSTGVPPEPTTGATPTYPPGIDPTIAAAWFGEVVVNGTKYRFDADGPVSRAWLDEGRRSGQFPRLLAVESHANDQERSRRYFRFDGGLTTVAIPGQAVRVVRDPSG